MGHHLQKFDAGLAGGDAPDVIELGNTEMTKYMAAGAFKTLSQSAFPNNKTWLQGLKGSCQYNGKLYGVPYYAGARAVIYRKDQYKGAGIKSTPKSFAQFLADGKKLMKKYGKKDGGYSAIYRRASTGTSRCPFVYDYGGKIAVRSGGKWKGTLNSPQAMQALNQVKTIVQEPDAGEQDDRRGEPAAGSRLRQGQGRLVRRQRLGVAVRARPEGREPVLAPVVGAYPMPSHIKGKFMPTFLGGSDLGGPVTTKNQSLAVDWIKAFTSSAAESEIAKAGNIANTTTLLAYQRLESEAGAVRTGGEVQLVRPHEPELGQRGECERAAGHARQDRQPDVHR